LAKDKTDEWKLSRGFPRCPKCGAVMDWDADLDEDKNVKRSYFFCWNDDTEVPDNREANLGAAEARGNG
jgi:hypothetical protein